MSARPGLNADGTREVRGTVNDELHHAGDHLDLAIEELQSMAGRALEEYRMDDVINLAQQVGALVTAGRIIAEHIA